MNTGDRIFSIICLGLSLWLVLESFKYDYTVRYTPGPGFLPFWLGVVLAIFALAQLIETFMTKGGAEMHKSCLPPKSSLYRLGLIMLITLGAAMAMDTLGFVLTVFLYVSVLLFVLEGVTIIRSLLTGLIFSGCIFLIFQYGMEVELPRGFLDY